MKIKRIKNVKINCFNFTVKWDKTHDGGCFNYRKREIEIGVRSGKTDEIFMILCHEIMEVVLEEMNVRMQRRDCDSDYIFVFDHRQFETAINIFSGIMDKFID